MTPAPDQLNQLVQDARYRYARLVLVVGPHGAGKTALLEALAAATANAVVNIGAALPPALFDIPSKRRPVTASDHLAEILRESSDPAVIDNIEVLFEPQLHLDPLKLLQDSARNRVIVAAWPGTYESDQLLFGGSGHPESRTYASPDAAILAL